MVSVGEQLQKWCIPSLKLIYPLKIDGWMMSLSFWDGLISGVLVLGSVIQAGDLLCDKALVQFVGKSIWCFW